MKSAIWSVTSSFCCGNNSMVATWPVPSSLWRVWLANEARKYLLSYLVYSKATGTTSSSQTMLYNIHHWVFISIISYQTPLLVLNYFNFMYQAKKFGADILFIPYFSPFGPPSHSQCLLVSAVTATFFDRASCAQWELLKWATLWQYKSAFHELFTKHEREKRRAYEQRVLEVEHDTFTPLVLSTSGGWGPSATVAVKRLAGLFSEKYDQPYSSTLSFIRCKIAFSLIDSAISCLRAPRSAFHTPARDFNLTDYPLDLIRAEVQLEA